MKIGGATLGPNEAGEVKLGSLEMLGPDGQLPLLAWPTGIAQVDTAAEMSQPEPSDLVIMNPPFTRDSLRHDQFSKDVEKKIKDREKGHFRQHVRFTCPATATLSWCWPTTSTRLIPEPSPPCCRW